MATKKRTRVSQDVQFADFRFDIAAGDSMKNTSGVDTNFKAAAGVFDVIPLPYGAKVVGGAIVVRTQSDDSGTATIAVGDSASASRYKTATSIKSAALTALVPTGYIGQGEPLRITLANQNGDATAGKVEVNVQFVIDGKGDENISGSQVAL